LSAVTLSESLYRKDVVVIWHLGFVFSSQFMLNAAKHPRTGFLALLGMTTAVKCSIVKTE